MKPRALAMPAYVAQLIRMPLARMELEPSEAEEDIVSCALHYENGTVLSLVVMCIAKRGWFRETPMLVVSIVGLESNTGAVQVHSRETMAVPADPDDVQFVLSFTAMVRAMAWTVAATNNIGECVSLPGKTGSIAAEKRTSS
jgi:hypothetical protein